MKEFLLIQVRPEDGAADEEYEQFLHAGKLSEHEVARLRLDQQPMPDTNLDDYSAVIVGGTPYNVSDPSHKKSETQRRVESELHPLLDEIIDRDFPYFGACYGLGVLAEHLQPGVVSKERYAEETTAANITPVSPAAPKDPIMSSSPDSFKGFVGHKESVQELPNGAEHLARSETCPIQMIKVRDNIYAAQFHPELDSHGLAARMRFYMNHGYFNPEEAESLIEMAHREIVIEPARIFQAFVSRFRAG